MNKVYLVFTILDDVESFYSAHSTKHSALEEALDYAEYLGMSEEDFVNEGPVCGYVNYSQSVLVREEQLDK